MIKVDLQSRIPLYEQLKIQIIKLSMLGVLDENQKLPSVRSLAREIGINPNTVQKAYQKLEQDGIIYTVSGKGCFAALDMVRKQSIRAKVLEDVKEASKNASDCGCSRESILLYAEEGCSSGGSTTNTNPSLKPY